MSSGRGDKKDDDEYISPFAGIDKSVVLQSARIFSDRDLRSKDAIPVMTKLLYLLTSGKEAFLENESIELFFQATKLFGNKNTLLRRLLYLLIKQLDIDSDNILMATASITKDINEAADTLKANAIRVLCAILDPAMLAQVERLIKQSIVSKSSNVAAAALVSSIHLMQTRSADVVARWTPEVTAALSGKDASVQFLALGLLHQLKSHDRLAVTRLVQNHTRGSSLRSPHALCYLIRIVADLMADADEVDSGLYDWLEIALRHKSEMVTLEAARAICGLPHVSSRELTPAVTVLQLFAGSVKATLRFAAVRTLHGLASVHPDAVATASVDLESLVSDSNRAISTLAITTLLKVGSESSVNRLVQQISDFISEIPDEYKIVVIDSVRSLSVKFPGKSRTMMGFLSSALRDDGSFSYKKAIVDSVIDIATNADGRAAALDILVEFIEDNEHSTLSCLVLDFVGREAPLTTSPAKYLRYIYNRVILEKASVRAAAVSALASIGLRVVALREQVVVLLQRVLMDVDDEVRDRATFFLSVLASEGDAGGAAELMEESAISLKNLEASLIEYQNAGNTEHSFKLSDVPIEIVAAEVTPAASSSSPAVRARNESARQLAALAQVPQLAALGKPYRTSKAIPLTDAESEFVVSVVKHSYVERMVFQFTVTNTVEDVLLENVVVEMEPDDDDFAAAGNVALPILRYGPPGVCFAVFELDGCPTGTFACSMQMVAKDVDPETGDAVDDGVPDEYPLEDLDVTISDFVAATAIPDFASGWEKLGEESVEVFVLPSFGTVPTAIASLLEFLGVAACDRTDNAEADATAHTLLGSGIFSGSVPFVIRARLKVTDSGVAVELTVRSTDAGVAELIASSVA